MPAAEPDAASESAAARPAAKAAAASIEGGRAPMPSAGLGAPLVAAPTQAPRTSNMGHQPSPPIAPTATDSRHSEAYYETKGTIFGALIEAIDLAQLA